MTKEFLVVSGEGNSAVIRVSKIVAAFYWGLTLTIETDTNKHEWELDSEEDLEEVWKDVLEALGAEELEGESPLSSELH